MQHFKRFQTIWKDRDSYWRKDHIKARLYIQEDGKDAVVMCNWIDGKRENTIYMKMELDSRENDQIIRDAIKSVEQKIMKDMTEQLNKRSNNERFKS